MVSNKDLISNTEIVLNPLGLEKNNVFIVSNLSHKVYKYSLTEDMIEPILELEVQKKL